MKRVLSKYRNEYSMIKHLTQISVLTGHIEDPDIRDSVEQEPREREGSFFIRTENPCLEPNIHFHGYRLGKFN